MECLAGVLLVNEIQIWVGHWSMLTEAVVVLLAYLAASKSILVKKIRFIELPDFLPFPLFAYVGPMAVWGLVLGCSCPGIIQTLPCAAIC